VHPLGPQRPSDQRVLPLRTLAHHVISCTSMPHGMPSTSRLLPKATARRTRLSPSRHCPAPNSPTAQGRPTKHQRNFTSPRRKSLSWFDSSSHSPHSLEPCHTFLILSNVRRQAEPSRPKALPLPGSEQPLHPNPSSPAHTPLCSVGRHRQRR
jgi:hypothetical protein